jgi:acetylornithine deacetylase/succinyl-diaminopimelate desuccinylase-like protein
MDFSITDEDFDEALGHLRHLIAINTSNPPGNERLACDYISRVFRLAGVPYEIVQAESARRMVVARLEAGSSREDALLISAHLDTVPADEEGWEHPPFSGEVADGFVWGRGAVDMKHMVVFGMFVLVLLKRKGISLKKDVVFAGVADEEEGCEKGSLYLVEKHKDLIRARDCLTEVGGFTMHLGEKIVVPVGIATKGFAWVRVRSEGQGGHASMPLNDSAITRLVRALKRLENQTIETRLCPQTMAFFAELAHHAPMPQNLALHLMTFEGLVPHILKKVKDAEMSRYFRAITGDTATITMLGAGQKENCIPEQAGALVDVRVLPGRKVTDAVQKLQSLLGDDVAVEIIKSGEPTVTNYPTPLWDILKETSMKTLGAMGVVPYVCPGFTDALAFTKAGIETYGFAPVVLPPDLRFGSLFHGKNERIPIEGFKKGLEALWQVVLAHCR